MLPANSERLIGISDAFSAFVYGYPSSWPRAQCTPNKSLTTLRYTRRHGLIYTGHACRHLPSAVPWISEDRLLANRSGGVVNENPVSVSLPLGLAYRQTHNALLWNGYLCCAWIPVFLIVLVRWFEFYFSCFVDKTL